MLSFIIKIIVHYDHSVKPSDHYFSFDNVDNDTYELKLITGTNSGASYNTTFNFPNFQGTSFQEHEYSTTIALEAMRMLKRAALIRRGIVIDARCKFIPSITAAETSILLII